MTGIDLMELYNALTIQEQKAFDRVYQNDKINEMEYELNRLDMIERRLSVASGLQSIYDETGKPYFDVNWIVKTIFKFTDEELKVANAVVRTNN